MSEINVNDGKGLYDYEGLINTLIIDCNDLPKSLFDGQYVQFCNSIVQMVQKLVNLREGLKKDFASRDATIEMYREATKDVPDQPE